MASLTNGNVNHGHASRSVDPDTTDVCDSNSPLLATGNLRVLLPIFQPYGRRRSFSGHVVTVKTFEDNGVVVEAIFKKNSILKDDRPHVLVIDAGGSLRRSMVGSVLAQMAHNMGWAGIVVNGCIRDIDEINAIDIGIRALGPVPVRSSKKGGGEKHVTVQFAGALIRDGDWMCVDSSGIVVSSVELSVLGPVYQPVYHEDARSYTYTMADYTSPVEPLRLFKAHCLDDNNFMPKFLPEYYENIDVIRDDNSSFVGCVKLVHFPSGYRHKYVKNRVDEVDMENLYIRYTTIEGDTLGDKWDDIEYEIEIKPSTTGSHFKMLGHFQAKEGVVATKEDVKVGQEDLKNIHKAVQEFLLLYPHLYI